MTRLGHGSLAIERDWVGVDELFGSVLPRLRKLYPAVAVELRLPAPAPLLHVHPALVEQALFNVLENAAKFSPPGYPIVLAATRDADGCCISTSATAARAFRKTSGRASSTCSTRSSAATAARHGTGLGLTICQGMIGAHGGSVEALPVADGHGTTIRITLPLSDPPTDRPRDDAA